jgi:hypothetical protein
MRYSSEQYMLLMKDVTPERFADNCDTLFSRYSNYVGWKSDREIAIKVGELRQAIEGIRSDMNRKKKEIETLEKSDSKMLDRLYGNYVQSIERKNMEIQQKFEKDKANMEKIKFYSAYFPHLDYVWEGLEEPELELLNIIDKDSWKRNRTNALKTMVRGLAEEINQHIAKLDALKGGENEKVKEHERAKKEFLEAMKMQKGDD